MSAPERVKESPAATRGSGSIRPNARRRIAPERVKESPKTKPSSCCAPAAHSGSSARTQAQLPPNSSCCRSRGGMRGWPVHRPTHAPATSPQNKRQQRPPQNQKPLVLPLPRRHAWLAGPPANTCPRNKPSKQTATTPPTKPKTPRAAAPAAACVAGRSTGANTCPRNKPSKQTATTPPHKTKNPSCRHSVAACVSDHSRGCERISPRHRSNPQRKKQHRHSGIFRVADLGPGTMPRGKYPESPAPAGSHALISRTPTPGGMLHANLGLPRPPPRNFQPPLPRFPSRLSPRRMSGTTVGRILSHPLQRSPRAADKTPNPINTLPPPSCSHSRACERIPQNKKRINPQRQKYPESPPQGGHAFPYMLVLLLCGREGSFEN